MCTLLNLPELNQIIMVYKFILFLSLPMLWRSSIVYIILNMTMYACVPNPLLEKCRTNIYTCCRDGDVQKSLKLPAPTKKRKGRATRKLGSSNYCLASMTVNECMESGVVTVKYVMTHTNHHTNLSECKHLPLPKCVVDKVRLQLASGVKIERVLDGKCIMLRGCFYSILLDIRSDLSSRSKRKYFMDTVHRRHFITRQDCRNIW